MIPETHLRSSAALIVLIVLQSVMLISLFAGVAPHPPAETPLFGIAPFIGAALAAAAAAIVLGCGTVTGRGIAIMAALMAAVSFGPQKYFDPNFGLIWPAVIVGQIAIAVLIVAAARGHRGA